MSLFEQVKELGSTVADVSIGRFNMKTCPIFSGRSVCLSEDILFFSCSHFRWTCFCVLTHHKICSSSQVNVLDVTFIRGRLGEFFSTPHDGKRALIAT